MIVVKFAFRLYVSLNLGNVVCRVLFVIVLFQWNVQ
jgi:hypothetical protein